MMLDRARAAAQSDPDRNAMFARRWTGPPPRNRKGQGRDTQAHFGKLNIENEYTAAERAAQRAIQHATRRVWEIEQRAALLDAIGLRDAGLRPGAVAASLRAEVLE